MTPDRLWTIHQAAINKRAGEHRREQAAQKLERLLGDDIAAEEHGFLSVWRDKTVHHDLYDNIQDFINQEMSASAQYGRRHRLQANFLFDPIPGHPNYERVDNRAPQEVMIQPSLQ
jgi:hypothetical protein